MAKWKPSRCWNFIYNSAWPWFTTYLLTGFIVSYVAVKVRPWPGSFDYIVGWITIYSFIWYVYASQFLCIMLLLLLWTNMHIIFSYIHAVMHVVKYNFFWCFYYIYSFVVNNIPVSLLFLWFCNKMALRKSCQF